MTAQEFIQSMNGFLALEVWQYDNKYVVAGTEYTLGESVADILNLDNDSVHQPYLDMDLALARNPSGNRLNKGLITIVQDGSNKILDALFKCKPYVAIDKEPYKGTLTGYFGDRLSREHTHFTKSDWDVFKAYYMYFYALHADILRAQFLFHDFLDHYLHGADSDYEAYDRFLDSLPRKQYRDQQGQTYSAQAIMSIASPMVIDFGIPPKESGLSKICEVLHFASFFDFLRWELMKAMMHGVRIRRCKHCGRFFILSGGYAYEYCANPAPGDDNRTCREVGALRSHEAKIKNDPVWAVYRRAYKKYHARVSKKQMAQDAFLAWAEQAVTLRERASAGEISVEALTAALNAEE